jgi:hypothetical protein
MTNRNSHPRVQNLSPSLGIYLARRLFFRIFLWLPTGNYRLGGDNPNSVQNLSLQVTTISHPEEHYLSLLGDTNSHYRDKNSHLSVVCL